jgi:hypothetical protein
MGDKVTWQGNSTVAHYMQDDVAEQGNAASPGSDGASPYPPGLRPPALARPGMGDRITWQDNSTVANTCR